MELTNSDVRTIETAEKVHSGLHHVLSRPNRTPDVSMFWSAYEPDIGRASYGSWELLERIDAALEQHGSETRTSEPLDPVFTVMYNASKFPPAPETMLLTAASHYQSAHFKPRELIAAGVEALFQELMAPHYRKTSRLLVEHAHQSAVGFS
jgi:hypothetical protein